ncbi:hypothetical protein Bca4012_009740 [Brassica carinata]
MGEGGFKYITNTEGSQICLMMTYQKLRILNRGFYRSDFKVLWIYALTIA